jgi:hypothetical protein
VIKYNESTLEAMFQASYYCLMIHLTILVELSWTLTRKNIHIKTMRGKSEWKIIAKRIMAGVLVKPINFEITLGNRLCKGKDEDDIVVQQFY